MYIPFINPNRNRKDSNIQNYLTMLENTPIAEIERDMKPITRMLTKEQLDDLFRSPNYGTKYKL